MRLAPTMRRSSGNSPCSWASATLLLRPRSRPCRHGCRTNMTTCGGWRCTPWDASPPRMRSHSAGRPGQAGVNISASWRCGRSKPSRLPGCDTTFLQPRRRVESSWQVTLSTLSKERQAANARIAAFRFPLSACCQETMAHSAAVLCAIVSWRHDGPPWRRSARNDVDCLSKVISGARHRQPGND